MWHVTCVRVYVSIGAKRDVMLRLNTSTVQVNCHSIDRRFQNVKAYITIAIRLRYDHTTKN